MNPLYNHAGGPTFTIVIAVAAVAIVFGWHGVRTIVTDVVPSAHAEIGEQRATRTTDKQAVMTAVNSAEKNAAKLASGPDSTPPDRQLIPARFVASDARSAFEMKRAAPPCEESAAEPRWGLCSEVRPVARRRPLRRAQSRLEQARETRLQASQRLAVRCQRRARIGR